eukprot:gene25073-biopygen20946
MWATSFLPVASPINGPCSSQETGALAGPATQTPSSVTRAWHGLGLRSAGFCVQLGGEVGIDGQQGQVNGTRVAPMPSAGACAVQDGAGSPHWRSSTVASLCRVWSP